MSDPVLHGLSKRLQAARKGVEKLRESLLGLASEGVPRDEVERLAAEFESRKVVFKYAQFDLEATLRGASFLRKIVEQSS